jgi:DHA1 family multidrug resistance protein-like MFS transporter
MVERSLVSFVIVMSAMAFVTRAWHIFALRAVQGVFAGYGGLTLAMAAESAPRERMARAIGLVQTAQRLGPALGPVIGGVVAEVVGIRRAFFVTAFFYALALAVVFLFYNDPVRTTAPHDDEQPDGAMGPLLRAPQFALMMGAIFVLTFVDRSFGPILPLHLAAGGRPVDRVVLLSGVLFSVAAGGAVVGNQACEWLMRRLAPASVIAWGSAVTAAGLAGFLLAPNAAVMGVSLLAFGAGAGAGITAAYTAGGRVVPASAHATGFGFLTGSSLAGLALSPVLAGALSRSHLLAVFAVDLVLLVGIALVTVRSATPRIPNPESRIPES